MGLICREAYHTYTDCTPSTAVCFHQVFPLAVLDNAINLGSILFAITIKQGARGPRGLVRVGVCNSEPGGHLKSGGGRQSPTMAIVSIRDTGSKTPVAAFVRPSM